MTPSGYLSERINMVYVISMSGKPLMPTTPRKARLLLKNGKAKCIRRTPFTIKLLYKTTEYTQPLTHGLDAGSGTVGSVVADDNGNVVYASEIFLRQDIKEKMDRRRDYRRTRRGRLRNRENKNNNRKNSKRKDRISPTVLSKINSHLKEVRFVQKLLPITSLIVEGAIFDPHALKNPEVLNHKWLYQKGTNFGYANTKAYVRHRDGYICHHCKGKSKDPHLHVHHIIFRRNNGSDEPENLITLCETCHNKLHDGKIKLKLEGKELGSSLAHATQMNCVRSQLMKRLDCEETYGYITSELRQFYGLPKEHYVDAAVIATRGLKPNFKTQEVLLKKCVADGDYRQTSGRHSEVRLTTRKISGFRKYDKVLYLGNEYLIRGRMSTGYAQLMDIYGKAQKLLPIPKFSKMTRLSARDTWIIQAKTIQSIA